MLFFYMVNVKNKEVNNVIKLLCLLCKLHIHIKIDYDERNRQQYNSLEASGLETA